ncbi:MAG: DUF433 domain-containing protein [Acidobacteriota bacterium]|nr:DUF433 domain-containing protein [Acidobacteriota bacterium]
MTPIVNDRRVPLIQDNDGAIRVIETRIPLETIINAYEADATPGEIVFRFDSLRLTDVCAVLTYYLKQKQDVESYLAVRKASMEKVRKENLKRFPQQGIRERLLARRG